MGQKRSNSSSKTKPNRLRWKMSWEEPDYWEARRKKAEVTGRGFHSAEKGCKTKAGLREQKGSPCARLLHLENLGEISGSGGKEPPERPKYGRGKIRKPVSQLQILRCTLGGKPRNQKRTKREKLTSRETAIPPTGTKKGRCRLCVDIQTYGPRKAGR